MYYDNMSKGKKVAFTIVAILLFALTTGLVWLVYHSVGISAAEEWYGTLMSSEEKIKNFADIFNAQVWHYMNHGGETLSATLIQVMILSGELVADIVNTIMLVLTAIIITAMTETMTRVKRSFPERIMCVTMVMGLILGIMINSCDNLFTQSGACTYVYGMVFVLLFIWVYLREIPYDCFGSKAPLWGVSFWILPLGLLAGWSSPNMGLVSFIFTLMTISYVKKVDHNSEPWMGWGSFFCLVGTLANICAPGNIVRMHDTQDLHMPIYMMIYNRFEGIFTAALLYLMAALVLAIVSVAVCNCVFQMPIGKEARYMFTLAIISWVIMILAFSYPTAATYGTLLLIIMAIIAIWLKIYEKKYVLKTYAYYGAGLIWLRGIYIMAIFVATALGLIS